LQTYLSQRLCKVYAFPTSIRRTTNVCFVAFWLYTTGPFLTDDFARSGVWLFEPLPVSFMRGLTGQGWWKWGGRWAGWSDRPEWWLKGIAVY
jgi:hypothetical protein